MNEFLENSTWVVEYSRSQNAFHVQTKKERENKPVGDWEILGEFASESQARQFCQEMMLIRNQLEV